MLLHHLQATFVLPVKSAPVAVDRPESLPHLAQRKRLPVWRDDGSEDASGEFGAFGADVRSP